MRKNRYQFSDSFGGIYFKEPIFQLSISRNILSQCIEDLFSLLFHAVKSGFGVSITLALHLFCILIEIIGISLVFL